MMGELCLGALRLQGRQSFWAAEGTGYRLACRGEKREDRNERKRGEEGGFFLELATGDLESYWRKNAGTISASYGFSYVQGTL